MLLLSGAFDYQLWESSEVSEGWFLEITTSRVFKAPNFSFKIGHRQDADSQSQC
jgi:hypothetical protein